jgi:hypothetical protein
VGAISPPSASESVIGENFLRLDQRISDINSCILSLAKRLEPVLEPSRPSEHSPQCNQGFNVPLAQAISNRVDTLDNIKSCLEDLLLRLDLRG